MKKIILFAVGILTSVAMLADDYVKEGETTRGYLTYEYGIVTYDDNSVKNVATLISGKDFSGTKPEIKDTIVVNNNTYNVTTIGKEAFKGKTNLDYVIIPFGVTTIESGAFQFCSSITKLELPSTIETIGTNAFSGCDNLIYVGNKITDASLVNPDIFSSNNLMTLFVPVKSRDAYVNPGLKWDDKFGDRIYGGDMKVMKSKSKDMTFVCATGEESNKEAIIINGLKGSDISLEKTYEAEDDNTYTIVGIGKEAFISYSDLNTLDIKADVTTINNNAFLGCSNLKKVKLPSTLKYVGTDAFKGCNSLIHIECNVENASLFNASIFPAKEMMTLYVPDDNEYKSKGNWKEQFNGRIFKGQMVPKWDNKGNEYVCSTDSEEATLYKGINEIEVTIPPVIDGYRVTGIDKAAFLGCTSINKLTILENVTTIGPDAFRGCSNLKSLELPSALTKIYSNAFNGCNNLDYVLCKNSSPTDIDKSVFSNKTKPILVVPETYTSTYKSLEGWNFTEIYEGDYVEVFNVKNEEYTGSPEMTYLGWGQQGKPRSAKLIKGIAGSADIPFTIENFANSNKGKYPVIAIADNAFSSVGVFENLTIKEGIKKIGANAFSNRSNLRIVTLPQRLEAIGNEAFKGCNNLVEIVSNIQSPFELTGSEFPNDDVILYVPSGTRDLYNWNFKFIYQGERKTEKLGNPLGNELGNLIYAYTDDESEAILIRSEKTNTVAPIVDEVNGKRVTLIAKSAFDNNSSLKSVAIPQGIQTIGKNAFRYCTQLNEVILPSTLNSIGEFAFERNTSLKKVDIPEGVTNIGMYAFKDCSNLEELILPSSLKTKNSIGDYAFYNSDKLSIITSKISNVFDLNTHVFSPSIRPTVYIPFSEKDSYKDKEGWNKFENYIVGWIFEGADINNSAMIYKCRTSEKTATLIRINDTHDNKIIEIPSKVTVKREGNEEYTLDVKRIDESVINTDGNKSNIEIVDIQADVDSIGANAFQGCSNLTKVKLPAKSNLKAIGDNAFQGCGNLNDFEFPSGLKSIGNNAFSRTKLEKIHLETIEKIGAYAFQYCNSLQNIWLPSTLSSASIGVKAFDGCNNIKNVNSKILSPSDIGRDVFSVVSTSNIATLFVPADAYESYNIGLWKNKFANIVKGDFIGEDTKDKLTYSLYSIAGVTEDDATLAAILTKSSSNEKEIKIKSSIDVLASGDSESKSYEVREIGAYAFQNHSRLNKVWLPKTMTSIGDNAFAGCTDIKEIVSDIEDVFKISSDVFSGDIKETAKVYIPSGSESSYSNKDVSGGWSEFKLFESGKWLETENPVDTYMKYRYHTSQKIATLIGVNPTGTLEILPIPQKVVIDDVEYTVTAIGPSVFTTNTDKGNIKTIDIQADIESIGANAFQGSSNLEKVILPSSDIPTLTSIDKYAFQGCGNLSEISFPSSLTSVGDYAFSGTKLSELRSDNIKSIGVGAFSTSKIKELRLGVVETIGENAFLNCGNLQNIWLPSTLSSASIGVKAFDGCNNIKNINSKILSPSDIGSDVFSVVSTSNIATLFVPADAYESYNIGLWKNKFANIVKGDFIGEDTKDKLTYSLYSIAGVTEDDATLAAILTKSSSNEKEIKIKTSIDVLASGDTESKSYEVREIGAYAFQNHSRLNKVWLPKTMTSIGDNAFAGCTDIKEIVSDIEDVFKISSNVFSGDIKETAKIYIPSGSESSYSNKDVSGGWSEFKLFESGKWLETENPVDTYMKYRYHTSQKIATLIGVNPTGTLETLPIPQKVVIDDVEYTVTAIGPSVFTTNTDKGNIKTIDIQADIESIGANAFQGSSKLTILNLPPCLEVIGDNAFQNCSNLQKIWLPASLTKIGSKAFAGCYNLTRICTESFATIENADAFSTYGKAILFIPTGALATINEKAGWRDFTRKYEGYYEAESPESVERTYIYLKQADESRNAILTKSTTSDPIKTTVSYDNKDYIVNIIGENAFNTGVNLGEWNSLPEGIVEVAKNAFRNCRLTELNLPSSLKTIGDGAFGYNGFSKIELPSTLTQIADNAIEGCNNLTEVFSKITDESVIANNALSVPNAVLYVKAGCGDKYSGWKFRHILDGDKLLYSVAGLEYAYTAASKKAIVVSVTKDALRDGAVTIPSTVTLGKEQVVCDVISIDKTAFNDIKADVKSVTIGKNMKTGAAVLQSCDNLVEVICQDDDNDFIINNVLSLPQATLYVPEHADWYKNAGWTFAHIYEGERLEKSQDGLVYAYTEDSNEAILVKVSEDTDWPNGKVTIPSSIKIEDVDYHVISIANSVFKDNIKIKTVEIGANIQSIGANAFQNCRNLKEVVSQITDPEVIGSIAFSKSDAILYIPNDGLFEAYSSSWKFAQIYAGERYEVENEGLAYVCVKTSTDKTATLVGLGTQGAGIKNGILDIPVSIPVTNEGDFNVVAIADNAFNGVNDIEYINVRSKALLESSTLNKDIFSRYVATLYVPHGALESYVLCDVWKTFPVKKEGYLKGVKSQDGLKYECLINGENKYVASLIKSENLVKVDIPTSVKLDGADDAYAVTSIYKEAFKGCNGLKVVWLPATLESIDMTAFSGCNNIAYVSSAIDNPTAADANIFPSSATLFVPQGRKSNYNIGGWNNFAYVGEGRFEDAATASDMSFDCYTDNAGQKKAILKKYNANAATVEIPGSVKVGNDTYTVSIIIKQAFASKTYMESLIIPSGVETIEAEAFNACSKLKWIESKIVNPISISNVFANTNATLFIPSNNVSDYKARGWNFLNVFVGERKQTDVDGWTYVYSTGDKKAVLTRVGNVGTNVTINGTFKIGREEYTVTSVGDAVFKGKSNIEALTIAKSIENIGANAFEGCVKLVSITCEGSSPAKLGADAFPSANVTVNVPNDAIDTYKNHADWKQFGEHILGITTSVEDDPTGPYNIVVPAGGDATPEVEIWNGLDASGDVVIPEVVELNGSDYKVTGIAANAYDSNTDLTSVVIPSSITSIGASAFAGCTNLKSITVYSVTPINLSAVATTRRALTRAGGSSSVFEGVNKETCILYVPAESIDAYKQAEGWKDFKKIYAISATAINGIVISEGKPFDVYNLQGRKVKANTTTFSGLPAGVYIVNGKKVMVK